LRAWRRLCCTGSFTVIERERAAEQRDACAAQKRQNFAAAQNATDRLIIVMFHLKQSFRSFA
jgi:hypothetical protein